MTPLLAKELIKALTEHPERCAVIEMLPTRSGGLRATLEFSSGEARVVTVMATDGVDTRDYAV